MCLGGAGATNDLGPPVSGGLEGLRLDLRRRRLHDSEALEHPVGRRVLDRDFAAGDPQHDFCPDRVAGNEDVVALSVLHRPDLAVFAGDHVAIFGASDEVEVVS